MFRLKLLLDLSTVLYVHMITYMFTYRIVKDDTQQIHNLKTIF
jgi:hypothetical protein